MNQDNDTPFGLIFAEPALLHAVTTSTNYDEAEDISFVLAPDGTRVPLVEFGVPTGTVSHTRVKNEETVADASISQLGTETMTKAQGEGTDSDDDSQLYFAAMIGTQTLTRVSAEGTDADDGSLVGTTTITEVKEESTDQDQQYDR
jgi:hypothetical protein